MAMVVPISPSEGRHVGMVELGEKLCFSFEPVEPLLVPGKLFRKHIDGHVPSELRVAGSIDFAHPARTDRLHDFVRAD